MRRAGWATARGRGSAAQQAAGAELTELADCCERICEQIDKRLAGERITDRLVSLHRYARHADPGERRHCRGRLRQRSGDSEGLQLLQREGLGHNATLPDARKSRKASVMLWKADVTYRL